MTRAEFEIFLHAVALITAVLAVVNLAMIRRRGASGYLMATAFLVLGATLEGYIRLDVQPVTIAGAAIVGILLLVDFIIRLPNQQTRKRR